MEWKLNPGRPYARQTPSLLCFMSPAPVGIYFWSTNIAEYFTPGQVHNLVHEEVTNSIIGVFSFRTHGRKFSPVMAEEPELFWVTGFLLSSGHWMQHIMFASLFWLQGNITLWHQPQYWPYGLYLSFPASFCPCPNSFTYLFIIWL